SGAAFRAGRRRPSWGAVRRAVPTWRRDERPVSAGADRSLRLRDVRFDQRPPLGQGRLFGEVCEGDLHTELAPLLDQRHDPDRVQTPVLDEVVVVAYLVRLLVEQFGDLRADF